MSRFSRIVFLCLFAVSGCSPALNWREIRLAQTPVKVMLPCKPDEASRPTPMVGSEVNMHMLGCEAGGALFAIAWVDVQHAEQAGVAMSQWQAAMLTNMQATSSKTVPFTPKGSLAQVQDVRVVATGRRQDGTTVTAQGAWFARGAQVFHAVMYAGALDPEAVEVFFSGIEFQ